MSTLREVWSTKEVVAPVTHALCVVWLISVWALSDLPLYSFSGYSVCVGGAFVLRSVLAIIGCLAGETQLVRADAGGFFMVTGAIFMVKMALFG